jgi:hypothetical protein
MTVPNSSTFDRAKMSQANVSLGNTAAELGAGPQGHDRLGRHYEVLEAAIIRHPPP